MADNEPLAYFLTWTTYGTWLPGDERGWVAKPGEFRLSDGELQESARRMMTEPALILDDEQRQIVEDTIRAHCQIRRWHLHVVNARTNHVHVVVTANNRSPEDVMDQFKAWCTRKLKAHDQCRLALGEKLRLNWWTQRGSKRQLHSQHAVDAAILYVQEGQGP